MNDDVTVLIAQRETVDLPTVMAREAEIRDLMKKLVEDNGYECQEGGNWMPGVLSRKKQVAAPILAS